MNKPQRRPKTPKPRPKSPAAAEPIAGVRIVGGRLRGRKLQYSGLLRTRPMKDRLREAIFSRIGPAIRGKHAVDLFAGTGALGLEALSRGAKQAVLIEQHYPTVAVIRQNVAALGLQQQAEVVAGNVFVWWQRQSGSGDQPRVHAGRHAAAASLLPAETPWVVFCSPPYEFYLARADEMRGLIAGLIERAPAGSVLVVEADQRLDFQTLPDPQAWDVRPNAPAVVGIYRKV